MRQKHYVNFIHFVLDCVADCFHLIRHACEVAALSDLPPKFRRERVFAWLFDFSEQFIDMTSFWFNDNPGLAVPLVWVPKEALIETKWAEWNRLLPDDGERLRKLRAEKINPFTIKIQVRLR